MPSGDEWEVEAWLGCRGPRLRLRLSACACFPPTPGGSASPVTGLGAASPTLGASEASGSPPCLCLYREFALGQDIAIAACS